jgi:hypothetical protein
MVLASVFYVDRRDSEYQLKQKVTDRMRNNTKWFGIKYDESIIDQIVENVRSHTEDFLMDGKCFKIFVKYRRVEEDSLSQQLTKKQNSRR